MDDFTRVNEPRVAKMLAMLDTITKSALSNKVDPIGLLKPLTDRLVVPQVPGMEAPPATKQRRDIMLWQEAQTAPLGELMMAYTTITSRLQDLVDEQKETSK